MTGIFYIDSTIFANATRVYTENNLTVVAPDGFYVFGGVYREQVDGNLLPGTAVCPECEATTTTTSTTTSTTTTSTTTTLPPTTEPTTSTTTEPTTTSTTTTTTLPPTSSTTTSTTTTSTTTEPTTSTTTTTTTTTLPPTSTTSTTTTEPPVTNYRFTLCGGEGIPTVTVGLNSLIAAGMPSNVVPTVGDNITISGSGNLTGCYEYVETVSTAITGPAALSWNECSCGTPL